MRKIYCLFVLILLLSCEKEQDLTISGIIVDKYTKKPIEGLSLSFDVTSGGGIFGGGNTERDKYFAITDEKGICKFTIRSDEKSHWFYFSDHLQYYDDTLSSASTHILDHSDYNNLYLERGKNKTIYFTPSGIVMFYIKKETINKLNFDSLTIKSKYEEDTIAFNNVLQSNQFFVEPYQTHKFEIYKIDNGVKTLFNSIDLHINRSTNVEILNK